MERVFQYLQENGVVSSRTFIDWATDAKDIDGKKEALAQVAKWIPTLQPGEDEEVNPKQSPDDPEEEEEEEEEEEYED